MKHIQLFEDFVNESLLQSIKDFTSGVKTDDDKLAKKLLSNINRIEDLDRYGMDDTVIGFKYEEYRFELFDGFALMTPPENIEQIRIRSKFLSKLRSRLIKILDEKHELERLKKSQEIKTKKDIEFQKIIKQLGGIDSIAKTILDKVKNSKSFDNGTIRLDKNKDLVMLAPTNTSSLDTINTLVVNLNNGETRLKKSYKVYNNYKQYDGKLSKSEIKSLDKYVKIAKNIAQIKDDNKTSAIRKLIDI